MLCPIPKPASRILTAAGPTSVPCDGEATVTTLAPFTDRKTGDMQFQYIQTCLDHSIRIACWKLIESIKEADKLAAMNRRIQTI